MHSKYPRISISNSMISCDIWHKYSEWYFKIVIHKFHGPLREWNFGQFWNSMSGTYAKYHEQITLLFVHTTTWEIQSCNAICSFSSSCFVSKESKLVSKFLFSVQLVQTFSQIDVLFSVFRFSFSPWISWTSESGKSFRHFFVTPRRDYFVITIVTVIFTCRYFNKLKYLCSHSIKLKKFVR